MAKVICCKDAGVYCDWIVGGDCPWVGRAETEKELLEKVKVHAEKDHGMPGVTYEMLAKAHVVMKDEN